MTQMAPKAETISAHGQHERDTGSSDVQVALLTERIRHLTEHLKINKKDSHTRRGLMQMVGQRNRLLRYLRRTEPVRYVALIEKLGIRGVRGG